MRFSLLTFGVALKLAVPAIAVPFNQLPLRDTAPAGTRTHRKSEHPAKSNYRPLPPLKEQDALEKQWLQERYARVPQILEK